MKKWVCSVCGYVYEGETPPEQCPVCKAPASKFKEQTDERTWAAEHVVGSAADAPEDIKKDEIEASMNHGVLNITIPKNTEVQALPKQRLIEIK